MFPTLKQYRRQRREAKREARLRDPSKYPADMDRDVVDTIVSVRDYTMTSTERIHGLCEAVRYICQNRIEGSIVECGVWRGGSMMAVAKTLMKHGETQRDLYLFDTFDGMSAPTDADVSLSGQTASSLLQSEDRGDAKSVWCVAALQDVKTNLQSTRYPADRMHFIPGQVEQTIPNTRPSKIALLRLDTDWYESTAHELKHLFPLLADGGVLIVDDYGHWEGARRAVDEYFESHGVSMLLQRLDYTGRIGIRHVGLEQGPNSVETSCQSNVETVNHHEAA
ncbi:MAG: TylF/MycF/NovP-related O-methyltransferase [Planctomycetota bacterium]